MEDFHIGTRHFKYNFTNQGALFYSDLEWTLLQCKVTNLWSALTWRKEDERLWYLTPAEALAAAQKEELKL
jgi:hypothetical protein